MSIIYHNRRKLSSEEERGARYVGFEELLSESDVVSLNLPLNEKTKGMIGKREFGMMKKGAVVVNTARGGVMDEGGVGRVCASHSIQFHSHSSD